MPHPQQLPERQVLRELREQQPVRQVLRERPEQLREPERREQQQRKRHR